MSSVKTAAAILLGLLDEYIISSDMWERHLTRAANGGYANKKDEEHAHRQIQTQYTLPLMQKSVDNGFKYVDLMELIKPPFRTDSDQRARTLKNLKKWAKKEYGL